MYPSYATIVQVLTRHILLVCSTPTSIHIALFLLVLQSLNVIMILCEIILAMYISNRVIADLYLVDWLTYKTNGLKLFNY